MILLSVLIMTMVPQNKNILDQINSVGFITKNMQKVVMKRSQLRNLFLKHKT